jgi:hypothetical protein
MTRNQSLRSRSILASRNYSRRLEIERLRRHIQTLLQLKVRPSDNDPKLNAKVAYIAKIYQHDQP